MTARRAVILTSVGIITIGGACWLVGNLPAICAMLSVAILVGVLAANWHGTRA